MVRKRSRLRIVLEILEVLSRGEVNPTRLATLVNMPYDRLSDILHKLNERGLVKINTSERGRVVSITPKGLELYEELKKVADLLTSYGLM